MFCGDDELRPAMLLPFEWNGKIYATDAHKLIRCDKSILEFELTNKEKPLNGEAVFPKENCNRILKTKIEDLEPFKFADDYDTIGKDVDCDECDGTGNIEWNYKHYEEEHDCPQTIGETDTAFERLKEDYPKSGYYKLTTLQNI